VAGRRSHLHTHVRLAVAGILIVAAGFFTASLPSIYAQSSFWTTSPTYFAIRVGVMMTALAALFFVEHVLAERRGMFSPLARFGRHSLFVYWIHVDLVYGYATWAIHRRLPFWVAVAAYATFAALMYVAVVGRDRVVEAWRQRRWQISFRRKVEAA